jgi:NAD(P)-dependent dehydrogenase (short-subunit alcohol dehydrogenase family)
MSWLNLANRTAIVTGGGSGIGRAVSLAYAKAGCNVLVADMNIEGAKQTVALLDNAGIRASYMKTNVAVASDVENMVLRADELAAEDGVPASILVNCAGITRDGWIAQQTEKDWDECIDVNLKGTWLTARAFAQPERMAKFKQNPYSGSIVNVASIVGKIGNLGQSNYAASKAGVLGITRALSKELAGGNVRVNAILPGFIDTPMTEAVPSKVRDLMIPRIALRKFGQPENIADLALFLGSDRSAYMTGCEIEVDGNLNM